MNFFAELGGTNPSLGGKARSLGELAATGLATPPGFVVTDALFRALCPKLTLPTRLDEAALKTLASLEKQIEGAGWPDGFEEALAARLAVLGPTRFAVRSSFANEDAAGQLGAGVYASRVDVVTSEVERAIRFVLCSAVSPAALGYALAHKVAPARCPVAILVHPYVQGEAEGSAALAAGFMKEPLIEVRRGQLSAKAQTTLGEDLAALAKRKGQVEIEWVAVADRLVYLQARPFVPPLLPAPWDGWNDLGSDDGAPSDWHWDAAHNPLPLSLAQTGLVQLADSSCHIGIRQRVLGGYLFYRHDPSSLPPAIEPRDAQTYFENLKVDVEARRSALGGRPTLIDALALFVSAYQPIFGVLQPALRQAYRQLRAFLENHAPAGLSLLPALRARVPSVATERRSLAARLQHTQEGAERERAVAAYIALFGEEAPAWDVAEPTFAEAPAALSSGLRSLGEPGSALDWRQASAQVAAMLAPALRETWEELLATARTAVSLGEADDWLYARVQTTVRKALLDQGKRLLDAGLLSAASDVFFLPLPLLLAMANCTAPSVDLAAAARAGRHTFDDARAHPPPAPCLQNQLAVRGIGTGGGRAIGRVRLHEFGRNGPMAADAILLAHTLLPTELPLLSASAIVTETGGLLDHVAAQARERGIPAVVGALGACSAFSEGDLVFVDAERGVVVRLAD